MLAAGTAIDWLVEDLGLISSPAESEAVAAACPDTGGVVAVPALLGFGTPQWDFGARGALFGLTRGTGRPEVVRAVLEGSGPLRERTCSKRRSATPASTSATSVSTAG